MDLICEDDIERFEDIYGHAINFEKLTMFNYPLAFLKRDLLDKDIVYADNFLAKNYWAGNLKDN